VREFILSLVMALVVGGGLQAQSRIAEITDIEGVRSNRIRGLGIVSGLGGTGDKSLLAQRMMANVIRRFGLNVDLLELETGNYAVVMVSAELDPFRGQGSSVDVTVSSLQKATSLYGGQLMETHLTGPYNRTVYAIASGPVLVGGAAAQGESGSKVQINVTTVGRVPGGARVEKTVPMKISDRRGVVRLQLKNPDWTTARNIAAAISQRHEEAAKAIDSGTVEVKIPATYRDKVVPFISLVQQIRVKVDSVSKVVVDERNGIIVAGADVRISQVAVSYGKLSVSISEEPQVVPSSPFTQGPSATTVPRSDVSIQEENSGLRIVDAGESIASITQSLEALGASPRQLIAILQQMKVAGALHAELVVK
jgi:flagellar P-ring protein FlgI